MSEHQKETAFLRRLIAFDNTDESRKLEERMRQGEHSERCILRAASLAGLFTVLGLAGFAYGLALEENFPYGETAIGLRLICEFGLASVVPLAVLLGLFMVYRLKFVRLREECRGRIGQLLESRLREPYLWLPQNNHFRSAPLAVATAVLAGNTENNGSVNRNDSPAPKATIDATDFSRLEGEGGREGPISNLVDVTRSGEGRTVVIRQPDQP